MESGIVILFVLASFLASALLFSAQPMIGKMVLPVYGGTPAVWNTCLVFFQATLLCGYLFSHGMGQTGSTAKRKVSGLYLLGFAALLVAGYLIQPIAIAPSRDRPLSPGKSPALDLLGVLCGTATVPLVMVSAIRASRAGMVRADRSSPFTRSLFSLRGEQFGQLAGLADLSLRDRAELRPDQAKRSLEDRFSHPGDSGRRLWPGGLVPESIAAGPRRSSPRQSSVGGGKPKLATWPRWIALVFVPASWLMGVTAYLTTDLAPVPLMWIIPLSLYLLSFILAFSSLGKGLVRAAGLSLPYLIMPLVLVMFAGLVNFFWIPLHLATFFAGALACHGALARMRPPPRDLSFFYITIALGGLLGGLWNTLVAPLVFNRIVEYPLAFILACLIAPDFKTHFDRHVLNNWSRDLLFAGVVFCLTVILATNQAGLADSVVGAIGVMIASGLGFLSCVTAWRRPIRFALVAAGVMTAGALTPGVSGRLLHIERNFFGVLRVTHDSNRNVNRLFHGSTVHGEQSLDPARRREPLTYFSRSGPIGQLFHALEQQLNLPGTRVAIVGLGVGTLASYARPGQRWTFYEIDGAVEQIARDSRFFTYLRDCESEEVEVILGDARQQLQGAPDGAYQLIVLDAFSSDALPVHLLSREAIRLYRTKLADGGLLLFNLTNRYLDLDAVIGRQASDAGLVCRLCHDMEITDEEKRAGKQRSIWAVIAAKETDLGSLASDFRWKVPGLRPGTAVWTDDYSDLASYLLFTQRRQ